MRRTKEDALKTRELIVDTAYHTFLENGYEGTTLLEIAKRANLSRGAMYWHFENKDVLYIEVIHNILEKIHQDKLIVINTDDSLDIQLTNLLSLPIKYNNDYRLVTYTSDLVKRFPQFNVLIPTIQDAKEKLYDLILELLNESIKKEILPKDFQVQVTCDTLYFLFEGFFFDGVENKSITYNQIHNIIKHLLSL